MIKTVILLSGKTDHWFFYTISYKFRCVIQKLDPRAEMALWLILLVNVSIYK